MKFTERV